MNMSQHTPKLKNLCLTYVSYCKTILILFVLGVAEKIPHFKKKKITAAYSVVRFCNGGFFTIGNFGAG